jgi:hypothetical protein
MEGIPLTLGVSMVLALIALWSLFNARNQRTLQEGMLQLAGMQTKNTLPTLKVVGLIEEQDEKYLRVVLYNPGNQRALLQGMFIEQAGERMFVEWGPYRPGRVSIVPFEECVDEMMVDSHRELIVKLPTEVDYRKKPMIWVQSSRGDSGETFRPPFGKTYLGVLQRVR